MSAIELPVTVEGDAFFYDADDRIVSAHEIAAALNAAPTGARREALEEAARAAENCDSPFNCPSDEQYEAVDLMARRIADTIRALIDQT